MSGVANQSMKPMGIERHRRSPKGERVGASEWSQRETVRHRRSKAEVADRELGSSSQSIESKLTYVPKRVSDTQSSEQRSRRESNPHLRQLKSENPICLVKNTLLNIIDGVGWLNIVLTRNGQCRQRQQKSQPLWICCYTDANGRRLKKSTKHTNKKKATEFCLALEHGEELARNGALSEARLRKLLEDTFERYERRSGPQLQCDRLVQRVARQKAESRSEATAERYAQVARDFSLRSEHEQTGH